MTFFAVLAALATWWGTTHLETRAALKMLQLLVCGALGLVLLVFGGFGYWWDTNRYADPAHGSLTLPVCGALILIADFVLMARSDADGPGTLQPQTRSIQSSSQQPNKPTYHRFTTAMPFSPSSLKYLWLARWRHAWALCIAFVLLTGPGAVVAQNLKGWDEWKTAYVAADGRVTDTGQRNISHSEGQGFGMVLATAANDKTTFDKIWHWTQANLATRPDGLFAWRWEPGRGVTDANTAADGDLFIAWGLQRAAERFSNAAYKEKAATIGKAIREKMVQDGTPWGTVLKPGVDGFSTSQGLVVNLSYWVFPAFDALNKVDPHPQWEALTKSGLRLTEIARFGRWGLPPDWLLLVNPLQPDPSRPPRYGYDAARVPLYLHWAGKADAGKTEGFQKFWTHFKCDAFLPGWANVVDNSIDSYGADPGVAAVRTLLMTGKPPTTRLPMSAQSYYSATLGMLVEVAAREGGRR